jgi:methylglutaconyl-CoA hydratase
VPAVISPYVIAAIGERQARRYFLSAEVFAAEEARRIGLLHDTVPGGELDAAVDKVLHWLSKGGPLAQREAKQLIARQTGKTPSAQKVMDRQNAKLIARLLVSKEGQEGLSAFLDKRQPRLSRYS